MSKRKTRSFRPMYVDETFYADYLFALAKDEQMMIAPKYACDIRQSGTTNAIASMALAKERNGGYFAIVSSDSDGEVHDLYTDCGLEAREKFVHAAIDAAKDVRW